MTAEEAARTINHVRPKLAIPIHLVDIVGLARAAERFRDPSRVTAERKETLRS